MVTNILLNLICFLQKNFIRVFIFWVNYTSVYPYHYITIYITNYFLFSQDRFGFCFLVLM